jgi:protein TonB
VRLLPIHAIWGIIIGERRWDDAMAIDRLRRERLTALIGAALVHALIGYALLTGLSVRLIPKTDDALKIFAILPDAPPPPPRQPPAPEAARLAPRQEGAASPRNLRSRATEVVAPPAPIFIPLPPPIVAAPVPAEGDERSSGASDLPGPGTGSGGQGIGTGSGRYGDGPGGGGGIGPRQIKGRIRSSDYPRGAIVAGASGMVSVRYTVTVDGSVSRCTVTRSSGSVELDDTTCRLIQQRFRFNPARDGRGRPVSADIVEDHEWIMERDMTPPDDR